jgi:hypothetical protein
MIGRGQGRTYKVKINTLLEHLKKNREEHVEIVEEAQAAFREEFIKRLDAMMADAKAEKRIDVEVGMDVPTRHTNAFDNAIGLLEMTMDAGEETIEIDAGEYERFVRNRWEWTRDFLHSNAAYSSKLGN